NSSAVFRIRGSVRPAAPRLVSAIISERNSALSLYPALQSHTKLNRMRWRRHPRRDGNSRFHLPLVTTSTRSVGDCALSHLHDCLLSPALGPECSSMAHRLAPGAVFTPARSALCPFFDDTGRGRLRKA